MILFYTKLFIFFGGRITIVEIRAVGMKKKVILAVFLISVVLFGVMPSQGFSATDAEMALALAEKLGLEFEPESLSVRVEGIRGFAEARGLFLSGVRIDRLQIEAILTGSHVPEDGDIDSLASLIGYSWGEIELLATDINDYFKSHDTRGFSNLEVRFDPNGFRAQGVFTKSLIFTFRIMLAATGNFGLRPDGVYIEDAAIYVENLRQPGFLVNEIMERANPLIEWSEIPFRVVFKEISMTERSAIMTGGPRDFEGGVVAVWNAAEKRAEAQ
jgi:hypothetical protein